MNDKRQYYRISDKVILDYKPVDSYTLANESPAEQFSEDPTLTLLAQFHQMDRQAAQMAGAVRTSQGEQQTLLDLCLLLNKKLNLLSRELMTRDAPSGERSTDINLSEGGVAFEADRPLYKGSYLAVRLVFLPSYAPVVLFARVVRCEPTKGDMHHIAADFYQVKEADQQLLAKHIMQVQREAKRQSARDQ